MSNFNFFPAILTIAFLLAVDTSAVAVQRAPKASRAAIGHTAYALTFNPDGKTIAAGGLNGVLDIWDAETGAKVTAFPSVRSAISSLVYTQDGQKLLVGTTSLREPLQLWDVTTVKPVLTFAKLIDVHSLALSPDESLVASGHSPRWNKRIWLYDTATGEERAKMRGTLSDAKVDGLAFSPDGKMMKTTMTETVSVPGLVETASSQCLRGW